MAKNDDVFDLLQNVPNRTSVPNLLEAFSNKASKDLKELTTPTSGMPSGEMETAGTSQWSQGPTFEDWLVDQPGGGNIDPNNPQGGDYWLEEYISFMYSNYGDPDTPVGGM